MVATATDTILNVKDMPDYVYQRVMKGQSVYEKETIEMPYKAVEFKNRESVSLQSTMDAYEKEIITEALRYCNGNKAKASRLLEIPRPTLLYKMDKLGIE